MCERERGRKRKGERERERRGKKVKMGGLARGVERWVRERIEKGKEQALSGTVEGTCISAPRTQHCKQV